MQRRTFLKSSLAASASLALGVAPRLVRAAEPTAANPWRKFDAVTRIEVANPTGVTRVWVPVPLLTDTDYFKRGGDTWTGNAAVTRSVKDPKYDVGLVYAEWPAGEKTPVIEITSRFAARDRAVDLSRPPVKIPARDVYGARCADSAEFKSLGKSGDISKAQHCRAEFYLNGYGWVPVDPADVRKVILEEGGGLPAGLADPKAQRARAKLFGAWEMNWLAYNYGHDVRLPNSAAGPVPFLMYPQAETAEGRKDSLEPTSFKYQITSREVRG